MPTQVTVAICTRDRSDSLRRTLVRLGQMHVLPGLSWELIIVDNGSTDDTADVARSFSTTLPIRYLREDAPGLANARNAALRNARGDVIAFTDDDCLVDDEWLTTLYRSFTADPDLACIGGRVELHDPTDLPITVQTERVYQRVHFGSTRLVIGANMAFARWAMDRIGRFDGRFGPGAPFLAADDLDYVHRLLRRGLKIMYDPALLVHHAHGRKSQEAARAIQRSYSIAGGAFYGKYLLLGDHRILRRVAVKWGRLSLALFCVWRPSLVAQCAFVLRHQVSGTVLYLTRVLRTGLGLDRQYGSTGLERTRHRAINRLGAGSPWHLHGAPDADITASGVDLQIQVSGGARPQVSPSLERD